MKRFVHSVLAVLLSIAAINAQAEGGSCPTGYYPVGGGNAGWTGCAPIPGAQGANTLPPPPGPQWSTRWGAIAGGGGQFGAANDMKSKRKASKAALIQCKARGGGKNCKVLLTFYNQCAAMAWGDNFGQAFGSPELADAGQRALNACQSKTSNCELAYSACSYPVRVR